ncbi:hypothetical protein FXW07_08935 [Methanosarcina sp. DH1]|uniref:hypothetical protein n=1 Tax=Methanosarcina sp. DH1 TaxID=2605695 RepID=UPI001E578EDE|nr:hypothetical protein [Methanosarcina sp. DH1]MCC4766733.1 hypothetical protein [Methanosarcina sp. DH1]
MMSMKSITEYNQKIQPGNTARKYNQKIQPENTTRKYNQKIQPENTTRKYSQKRNFSTICLGSMPVFKLRPVPDFSNVGLVKIYFTFHNLWAEQKTRKGK